MKSRDKNLNTLEGKLKFAIRIAKRGGKIAKNNYGKHLKVEQKTGKEFVTHVDKQIESMLVKAITKTFPDHAIIGEESGQHGNKNADWTWIIDPLDGTSNYFHGHIFFGVSIGLMHKNKLVLGVIECPMLRETYSAAKGHGAFLNEKRIHVSKIKKLKNGLLATGFHPKIRNPNIKFFETFLHSASGIRRCGAAALDLCYVAAGRFDGFWEFHLNPWDVAAGTVIVREAGGKVTNIDGSTFKMSNEEILATNGHLHSQMKNILNK